MLRITAKDFDLLLKVRETLIQVNEGLPADPETVEQFILYTKELEERREADLKVQRESIKKWRETPSGKEKNRATNTRNMRTYRAKKRAEKAQAAEAE
jgi:hypothetical protein